MLAEGIDLEVDLAAIGTADFLCLKVDRDGGIGPPAGVIEQLVDLRLREFDRQNAVLEAVVVEDVGEIRRNYATDAEV